MHQPPTRTVRPSRSVFRLPRFAVGLLLLTATLGAWMALSKQGSIVLNELRSRSPQELIRYTLRRLEGHPKLEWATHPVLHGIQRWLEREPPANLPNLGKGQIKNMQQSMQGITQIWVVDTPQAIRKAMYEATAGTYIEIAPGLYPFSTALTVRNRGTQEAPIVVGAKLPGTVWLLFTHVDGIYLKQPNWIFENLNIRGDCRWHDACEHAFHVVSAASGTVIRNNFLTDFNAHIKVNGEKGLWPDGGRLEHNTMTLSEPRKTGKPVVALDLVGANDWIISDNLVMDISKTGGNRVSYGMFMKGASSNGRFERNLVICSSKNISQPGIRVGLSFGGGNTGQQFCRDRLCEREHINGSFINNIVAHCNDSGLDINRSAPVLVAHNTLINTSGITLRQQPARAVLAGNLYDGLVLTRDNTHMTEAPQTSVSAKGALIDADALDLRWVNPPPRMGIDPNVRWDFFGKPRAAKTALGAVEITAPAPRSSQPHRASCERGLSSPSTAVCTERP